MAFPNIQNMMDAVYEPPMSLQQTMQLLNSTGLYNEKPIELSDAIMEANKVEQDQIKTEAANRSERVRQKIAENSLDDFGNPLPIDEVIKKASVFSLQEGDVDTAFKLYDVQEKREREEEQRISRLISQVRQIGAVNPNAAVDMIKNRPELQGVFGDVNAYDFEKLKTMGGDLGYYEDGQFVPTQRNVTPERNRAPKISHYIDNQTGEVLSVDESRDFETARLYGLNPERYQKVKADEIDLQKRMVQSKLKKETETENESSFSVSDLLGKAKGMITGKATPTPVPSAPAPQISRESLRAEAKQMLQSGMSQSEVSAALRAKYGGNL